MLMILINRERFWDDYKKGAIRKSTIRVYGRHVRHLTTFGAMDFVGIL